MLARSTTDAALNRDAAFQRQVDAVRLGHGLGRSLGLGRLFDYLIDVTRAGVVVAESDVAHGVFGRGDVAPWDASVRVAVHRLRRKLEAFYNGPGRNEPDRLTVPVGAYRLVLDHFNFQEKSASIERWWKPPHGVKELIPAHALRTAPPRRERIGSRIPLQKSYCRLACSPLRHLPSTGARAAR